MTVLDNKYYIEYFVFNDQVKEIKLDTERQYEPEIWEDTMKIVIYTEEEQKENFTNAMSKLENAYEKASGNDKYKAIAQVSKDIRAASESAKQVGQFLFPYNKETEKNMIGEFWNRYFELKNTLIKNAEEEVKRLIQDADTPSMLKQIKRAIYTIKVLNKETSQPLYALAQEKIDSLVAA